MSILLNQVEYVYEPGTAFEKVALYNVNLKIEDGEMIGLIGHTGSGKSTLIQMMNGLLKPTDGGVYYNGEDIHEKGYSKKELRSKVGLVFQYPEHQLFAESVIEDVKFGPRNIGMEALQVDLNSYEALRQVGIGDDLLDALPQQLSGGQKRRVAIAGVLAMKPEVLILDEPTAGLDPGAKEDLLQLITKLRKENNMTVIIVSHSMEDMGKYVERLVVMDGGTVAFDGPTDEVFSHYKELEKLGLRAPQVTYVIEGLARKGVRLPHNAIHVEQAVDAIMEAYNKKI